MGTPGEGIHDLMITVATPVFDLKNTTVKSANLLGVAGVDIPIREIVKYAPSHKLGANAYSFAVNNNGYVMYHRDLRPLVCYFYKLFIFKTQ
ncbi:voltage-dependent calcium channel alpha-2/delta: invertebrate-like protein [Leptotrombidium deliense]|uniref:Voltage-dependent calcium channel alpha-2/delta: invertebrate-like protein n=1 Tax=Leptotrombidium deliense TaxID=299467 RepID=A0A443SD41_9ACAR|nr:voltage-dependent calcium channel alpha-2/delta: invertebrate-like protein [Leptotrombidium deliense]